MVSSILEHTTQHGAIEESTLTRAVKYYNLYAIISVGYRVSSSRVYNRRQPYKLNLRRLHPSGYLPYF
ncbi:MAG: hypothetical protein ACR2PW_08750 [Gammaproteobacteria bacterium]